MPPLLLRFLISFFRYVLAGIGSEWLVDRGIIPRGEMDEYVAALAVAIPLGLWSLWEKYGDRIKLRLALRLPPMTEEALNEKLKVERLITSIKPNSRASLVLLPLLAVGWGAGVLGAPACALGPRPGVEVPVDPVRRLAIEGYRVRGYISEAQDVASALNRTTPAALPNAAYLQVLDAFSRANSAGVRLAEALAIWDAARPGSEAERTARVEADAALAALEALLPQALAPIASPEARTRVEASIKGARETMANIEKVMGLARGVRGGRPPTAPVNPREEVEFAWAF